MLLPPASSHIHPLANTRPIPSSGCLTPYPSALNVNVTCLSDLPGVRTPGESLANLLASSLINTYHNLAIILEKLLSYLFLHTPGQRVAYVGGLRLPL